jgi:hypothetical protein
VLYLLPEGQALRHEELFLEVEACHPVVGQLMMHLILHLALEDTED